MYASIPRGQHNFLAYLEKGYPIAVMVRIILEFTPIRKNRKVRLTLIRKEKGKLAFVNELENLLNKNELTGDS